MADEFEWEVAKIRKIDVGFVDQCLLRREKNLTFRHG